MADKRPIGVFDSGLGGLTVVRELLNFLPEEDIVYFGDTDRVPYGTKSSETIRKFARQDEAFLLSKDVKLIIAACGTVSSVASDIGAELPVPYIEVVSHASKAAAEATRNGRIGVIGTNATINNGAHERLIKSMLPDATVVNVGCPLFVPLVEDGWYSAEDPVVLGVTSKYLKPIIDAGCDTIILGCTHYPILMEAIRKTVGNSVALINMGVSTARAVRNELKLRDLLNEDNAPAVRELFVSDKTPAFRQVAEILLGDRIDDSDVSVVDVSRI